MKRYNIALSARLQNRFTKGLLCAVMLYGCFCVQAQAERFNVAAGIFIGIINEAGDGPYQQILKQACQRAGLQYAETVYPLQRAVKTFVHGDVQAIYGMTEAVLKEVNAKDILTSYPLGVYKVFVFTKKGAPVISSFDQLKGMTVGGINGYQQYYQKLVQQQVNIRYFASEANQLKRFEFGRIDAIIGFFPDWIPYLDKLDYDASFPIYQGYDYMTVWNSAAGKAFINKLSPALMAMHHDGTLKRILGKRYMEFSYRASKSYEWHPVQPNAKEHGESP